MILQDAARWVSTATSVHMAPRSYRRVPARKVAVWYGVAMGLSGSPGGSRSGRGGLPNFTFASETAAKLFEVCDKVARIFEPDGQSNDRSVTPSLLRSSLGMSQ